MNSTTLEVISVKELSLPPQGRLAMPKRDYVKEMQAMCDFYRTWQGPPKPWPYIDKNPLEAQHVYGFDSSGNPTEWIQWTDSRASDDAARAADRWGYHGY